MFQIILIITVFVVLGLFTLSVLHFKREYENVINNNIKVLGKVTEIEAVFVNQQTTDEMKYKTKVEYYIDNELRTDILRLDSRKDIDSEIELEYNRKKNMIIDNYIVHRNKIEYILSIVVTMAWVIILIALFIFKNDTIYSLENNLLNRLLIDSFHLTGIPYILFSVLTLIIFLGMLLIPLTISGFIVLLPGLIMLFMKNKIFFSKDVVRVKANLEKAYINGSEHGIDKYIVEYSFYYNGRYNNIQIETTKKSNYYQEMDVFIDKDGKCIAGLDVIKSMVKSIIYIALGLFVFVSFILLRFSNGG